MSDANTKHLRAARARVRGAITMLRQAVNLARMSAGVESMPRETEDRMLGHARRIEGDIFGLRCAVADLDECEREANAHQLESILRRRR